MKQERTTPSSVKYNEYIVDPKLFLKLVKEYNHLIVVRKYRTTEKEKKDSVKKNTIITEALLPENNLQRIADKYHLTKERVRQIIEEKLPYKKTKRQLLQNSPYFRCKSCGTSLNPYQPSGYCSRPCKLLTKRYDLSSLRTCLNCGVKFYPFNNWKQIGTGKYHCRTCYFEHHKIVLQGKP